MLGRIRSDTGALRALLQHTRIALRLSLRNRMALVYGYLFPIIFLLSFLALYRFEDPPLLRHMGALLTVGVLGGACFGLPTSLVSERERGVWRRYRLTPMATGALVTSTLLARYVTVLGGGLMQLLLAMAIGRWAPAHPIDLWLTYTLVAFAFLGLGLVIAALANTVPAVQALGQCLFLPMLIVGGVAVRLEALPAWALPIAAFLPGRYAVEALQACINGDGLDPMRFHLIALVAMGGAACVAGAKLFRWDSGVRVLSTQNKSWVAAALASWLLVGGVAVQRGALVPRRGTADPQRASAMTVVAPLTASARTTDVGAAATAMPAAEASAAVRAPVSAAGLPMATSAPNVPASTERWRALTAFDFAALPIGQVPPDDGDVSPIAPDDQAPAGSSAVLLRRIELALPAWAPGHVPDRVQRVRNYLLILGVADYAQSAVERFLPGAVLTHMLQEFPRDELAQLVCWVALHPGDGDVSALRDPLLVELGAANLDSAEVRTRTYYYGVKLTRWIIGW